MTEEEAKTKRCCGPDGTGTYLTPKDLARIPADRARWCIASECMAWRWEFVTDEDDDFSYSTEHGYCGLAGK